MCDSRIEGLVSTLIKVICVIAVIAAVVAVGIRYINQPQKKSATVSASKNVKKTVITSDDRNFLELMKTLSDIIRESSK